MKHLLAALLLLFTFATSALATTPPASASTVNGVKLDLINKLEADKYLTGAQAAEVKGKYIGSDAEIAAADGTSWTKWLSWVNLIKVLAVVLLLIAFSGFIVKIAKGAWWLITLVPTFVYQAVFACVTLYATIWPATIWASQAFYIALFGAFANIAVSWWVLTIYPKVAKFLRDLFTLGIPPYVIASFWGVLYFAVLAIVYSSQVFGFFAAVCLSAMFSFGLFYIPGILFLNVRDNALGALMISHTFILVGYVILKEHSAPYLPLFASGLEYYCSIGLGLAMLIAVSPFYKKHLELNIIATVVIFALAMVGYGYFGVHSIGAIIGIFTVLIVIEWILYIGWHGGLIFGTLLTGSILYGAAMFLERYGRAILANFGA